VTSNLSPIKMRHVKPCIMLMRYGPGVAAQVNSFLTRALPLRFGHSQTHAGIFLHSKHDCNTAPSTAHL